MELRNVKTFIKIAEIGNFSKAATELGYAQSTVTMQIQTLERELGVSLFERNGKSAVLSAAGKEFLDYAYNLQRCEAMAAFCGRGRSRWRSKCRYHGNVVCFSLWNYFPGI